MIDYLIKLAVLFRRMGEWCVGVGLCSDAMRLYRIADELLDCAAEEVAACKS
jgi:hypothetical protein